MFGGGDAFDGVTDVIGESVLTERSEVDGLVGASHAELVEEDVGHRRVIERSGEDDMADGREAGVIVRGDGAGDGGGLDEVGSGFNDGEDFQEGAPGR